MEQQIAIKELASGTQSVSHIAINHDNVIQVHVDPDLVSGFLAMI